MRYYTLKHSTKSQVSAPSQPAVSTACSQHPAVRCPARPGGLVHQHNLGHTVLCPNHVWREPCYLYIPILSASPNMGQKIAHPANSSSPPKQMQHKLCHRYFCYALHFCRQACWRWAAHCVWCVSLHSTNKQCVAQPEPLCSNLAPQHLSIPSRQHLLTAP